jgi:TolB-like protein
MAVEEPSTRAKGQRLDSWKAIAEYLGRDVRSVQRWERGLGLPVHRVSGEKGGVVFAFTGELERWLQSRPRSGNSNSNDRSALLDDPLAEVEAAATSPRPERESTGLSGSSPGLARARYAAVIAALVLVVACVSYVIVWSASRRTSSYPPKPPTSRIMLAVLPFMNLSGDPAQDYFADGLTEEMITDLGCLNPQALGVIARTSAMKYKNTNEDIAQIGSDLGVTYILEGSVRREGNEARISAQLIQVSDQTHVWAQNYELQVKDILDVQRDVAATIADKIQINLNGEQWTRFSHEQAAKPEAYDDYLRGRYAWNRRSVAEYPKAVAYFNRAVAKDPNFALAYAGLADTYTLMSLNSMGSSPQLLVQAKAASLKALALDDGLAAAHTSLAAVKVLLDWDWAGAESEFRRALDLNPNYAPAHHWYSSFLLSPLGRHDESIAELTRAQNLDPLSLIVNADIGYAYYLKRDDNAAFAQYQRVAAMDPSFVPVHFYLFKYYYHERKYDAAVQQEMTVLRLSGRPDLAQRVQQLFATGGFREVSLEGALAKAGGNPTSFYDAAEMHAAIEENAAALTTLALCYKAREPGLIYLKVDPVWDNLRPDPRFQGLEHRIGLD